MTRGLCCSRAGDEELNDAQSRFPSSEKSRADQGRIQRLLARNPPAHLQTDAGVEELHAEPRANRAGWQRSSIRWTTLYLDVVVVTANGSSIGTCGRATGRTDRRRNAAEQRTPLLTIPRWFRAVSRGLAMDLGQMFGEDHCQLAAIGAQRTVTMAGRTRTIEPEPTSECVHRVQRE